MKIKNLLAILALGLAVGCASDSGSGSTTGTSSNPAASNEGSDFKVALLTPGPVSDNGWSALAYQGLQEIKTQMGAEVQNQEAAGSKIRDAMRTYAQNGFNLVFGHGFEYNEFGVDVAKDFPNTVFVSSSGGKTAPNAGAFRFYLEQGCYLAGMMAAKMSKTGVIGSVAVQNYPSIVSTLKAYEAGAKAANPNIKIIPTVYFGTEGDVAKAKQATESVLAQKADFVIHQANAAVSGVFEACKEHGAYAFGTNADQNADESGVVVASATIVAGPAFLDLAKQVKAKTYKGSVQLFGMDKGAIDFVINPSFKDKVPADLQKMLADAKENIKSGKLVVPKDEF
jgi:basic membrane lipoprotein Med (substrate-binding protein (PBP1-ABC) superfamily)